MSGLNAEIMSADELVRWNEPQTKMEKVLLDKIKDFGEVAIAHAEEVEALEQDLIAKDEKVEELEKERKALEDELVDNETEGAVTENELQTAYARIDELVEELAASLV